MASTAIPALQTLDIGSIQDLMTLLLDIAIALIIAFSYKVG